MPTDCHAPVLVAGAAVECGSCPCSKSTNGSAILRSSACSARAAWARFTKRCSSTRGGRWRSRVVARIGAHAARALAFAHAQGFLHRDIKPSNLMVDHHNHVYLVDFGLTRALEADAQGTNPGVVAGTPWYMSPEQATGKTLD